MQTANLLPDAAELDVFSRMEIKSVDRASLIDIKSVTIDKSLPIEKRMRQYLEQIKNPYCFLCGKTPVKVTFSEVGKTLDEAIKDHYLGLKTLV
jgi:mevalonate kinase